MTIVESSTEVAVSDSAGIGKLLHQARVDKGMSTKDLAQELHLQVRQVEALEKGDFSGFSSPAFIKGYLRSYARLCGMNGDYLVRSYEAFLPQPKTPLPVAVANSGKMVLASGRSNKKILFVCLSVFLMALVSWLFWFRGQTLLSVFPYWINAPVVVLEVATVDAPAPEVSASTASVPPPFPDALAVQSTDSPLLIAPEQTPQDPELHIEFIDDCWVQLKSSDGTILHDKTHKKGEMFDMSVKTPLHIWFGRAAAVNVSYNGAVVEVPIKQGSQSIQFILGDEHLSGEAE